MVEDDLVARLRAIDHMSVEECFVDSFLFAKAADTIEALRKTLHDIYWEAMNLGTTHKWLASNDGEIDEYSPSYTVSQVVHEFARKVIKPAAQAHGVELFK